MNGHRLVAKGEEAFALASDARAEASRQRERERVAAMSPEQRANYREAQDALLRRMQSEAQPATARPR